jgi:hypothetical protein
LSLRTTNWLFPAVLLIGIVALFAGIDRYQHRFVRSHSDLLNLLPGGDATVFYARVDLLRRAGMLTLVRDTTHHSDSDYEAFVRQTGFDYSRDLDAVAGSVTHEGTFIAAKGEFHWDRIRNYVQRAGGSCEADHCELRASSRGKWISTLRMQRDVISIALGASPSLRSQIHPGQAAIARPLPTASVWVRLAPSLVKDTSSLPAALRIFLISLQPADSVLIAVRPPSSGSKDAFEIELTARCMSAVAADTVRKQLEIQTNMLKLELAHEHQQANPADLTGLLTAGRFDTSENDVRGEWPVSKELLKALQ